MFLKLYRGLKREEKVILESELKIKGKKKIFCKKRCGKARFILLSRVHLEKGEWCLTSFLMKGSLFFK